MCLLYKQETIYAHLWNHKFRWLKHSWYNTQTTNFIFYWSEGIKNFIHVLVLIPTCGVLKRLQCLSSIKIFSFFVNRPKLSDEIHMELYNQEILRRAFNLG